MVFHKIIHLYCFITDEMTIFTLILQRCHYKNLKSANYYETRTGEGFIKFLYPENYIIFRLRSNHKLKSMFSYDVLCLGINLTLNFGGE